MSEGVGRRRGGSSEPTGEEVLREALGPDAGRRALDDDEVVRVVLVAGDVGGAAAGGLLHAWGGARRRRQAGDTGADPRSASGQFMTRVFIVFICLSTTRYLPVYDLCTHK